MSSNELWLDGTLWTDNVRVFCSRLQIFCLPDNTTHYILLPAVGRVSRANKCGLLWTPWVSPRHNYKFQQGWEFFTGQQTYGTLLVAAAMLQGCCCCWRRSHSTSCQWDWFPRESRQEVALWPTDKKSYMIHRTAPFSMTLNVPYPPFQGHCILWRWMSQKWYEIQFQ